MNTEELLSLINPLVRSLGAYHLTPDNAPVKLNQNENPFDWPDEIKEKAAAYCRARPWNRYPDFIPRELRETLAAYVGVGSENIIAGNGSNEMLLVLLLSLASPSRPVIVCQPTFTVYRLLSGAMECRGLDVFLDDRLRFDTERLIDACRKNPGAVCIFCSPNNPTGSALSHEQIVTVLENHHGFVILDQAYEIGRAHV
jgi:histidinol-phosphate aminotransferase